jgi:haloacetate dehalogenase
MDRRLLLQGAAAAAGTLAARAALAAEPEPPFFPGFRSFRVKTSGAEINGVIGGAGPPILLLHGAPQSHVTWRLVAPRLAATHMVICPDLRGYGDSSTPPDGDNHVNYSKRAMALDQIEVMKSFGFDRFPVVGQDRGARVAHRLILDHPKAVSHALMLDIVPTRYTYSHFSLEFAQAYPHWFAYLVAAPLPENQLKAVNDAALARATTDVQKEYLRTQTRPPNLHAMCEDYRASASIDLKWDEEDAARRIDIPLRVLWAEGGTVDKLFDILEVWKGYARRVTGRGVPGSHYLQESSPDAVVEEIQALLKA